MSPVRRSRRFRKPKTRHLATAKATTKTPPNTEVTTEDSTPRTIPPPAASRKSIGLVVETFPCGHAAHLDRLAHTMFLLGVPPEDVIFCPLIVTGDVPCLQCAVAGRRFSGFVAGQAGAAHPQVDGSAVRVASTLGEGRVMSGLGTEDPGSRSAVTRRMLEVVSRATAVRRVRLRRRELLRDQRRPEARELEARAISGVGEYERLLLGPGLLAALDI